jgi:predicted HAD superfamily Cof-like phosphohydrolase
MKEEYNMNFLKQIEEFNRKAGLLEMGFNDKRENSFIIEEALEGGVLDTLNHMLNIEIESTPKDTARVIAQMIYETSITEISLSDVDRLDKAADIIVFAVGSMLKLGLTIKQIEKAMGIVCEANLAKLTANKDAYGKQLKPEGWVAPEDKLKQLLETRE